MGDDIATVLQAAEGMTVILNDVLTLGQLQGSSMQLSPVPTDCVDVIDRSVLALHGVTTVPIVCHIAASVPESVVIDPLRVGQVRTPRPHARAHTQARPAAPVMALTQPACFTDRV